MSAFFHSQFLPMESINIRNNLFSKENLKCYKVNNFTSHNGQEKNFIHGLHNARNVLKDLERSIRKSSKYERQLLQCKQGHPHSHDFDEWWDSSPSEDREFQSTSKSTRSQLDLKESWSTISIVCLQYQYEELSKRYEALLQAYTERCSVLKTRDASLKQLRQRARKAHAHLAHAHKAILAIGDKYLALKKKRNTEVLLSEYIVKCRKQKNWYEEQISSLKETVREVMAAAEGARLEFDELLAQNMNGEGDADAALLLTQIRKCNLLFLENLRLKAQIEVLLPGKVSWKNSCD